MESVRKIISGIICGLIALSVISSPVFGAKSDVFGFVRKLVTNDAGKLKRIAGGISPGSAVRKLGAGDIRKSLPDIDRKKLTPDVLKLTAIGNKIAESGRFGSRFINGVSKPAEAIRQYSRYGAKYVDTGESFATTVMKHAGNLSELSPGKLKKYGNLSKGTIAKFGKEGFVNSSFVSVIRKTGKQGYETIKKIGRWAKDHPKSSAAAALLIWYSTDPEGCTDAVGDVSEFLAKSGSEMVTEVGSGIGKGVSETLTEKWQEPSRQYFLMGAAILLSFLVICIRLVRRIIFFPFKVMGLKLNAYMDRKEARLEQKISSRSGGKEKKRFTFTKKAGKGSSGSSDDDEVIGLF